ncbi:MAG: hypothetical protein U9Q06_04310 [Nanoarchaeota archaeon]|nr:hypothetical protein [Nanoarchaeota archaeon]
MENYTHAKKELKGQKTKHIFLAVILAFLLLGVIIGFILLTEIPGFFLAILIIICLSFYSIILFFLIEQIRTIEIEVEKIKTIEKFTVIDNPIIERVEVTKPVVHNVPVPVYIQKTKKVPRGKRYKYIASKEGSIFHYATSRLSKLIRPKNKIQNDSPSFFIKKGYKPSARVLRRWKTEEKALYTKYGPKKKKKKNSKKKASKKSAKKK